MNQLILASGSPRRKELLELVNIPFRVTFSEIDESKMVIKDPRQLVEQLAVMKGNELEIKQDEVILSADTVVSFEGEVLTKPQSKQHAKEMLTQLNGKKHSVYTGVMIKSRDREQVFSVKTEVSFWHVSEEEIDQYVESGDPMDKAGGYGIQSKGAFLVREIKGDYYNVVGLPVSIVVRYLRDFNIYPK
ncbi:Maf family protein [Aquibacillus kalidii]|uniref:Maf family protein n=1 Tax=Aquibacillus kalidii TaxID=2762597 RepID=UPI001644AE09|nr:nucleoside triphosphate pyrophosphatase [Aquibacillus kalidii]